MLHPGPYVTSSTPGIGGRIKRYPQDFFVDEVLGHEGDDSGAFVLVHVEKTGRTTFEMISILSQKLGIPENAIRVCGMKDNFAVTRQYVSLEGVDPARILQLRCPSLRVLDVSRTDRPLRYGCHLGNFFNIRIRQANPHRSEECLFILNQIEERGFPNFFGPQRFGSGYEGPLAGKALLKSDDQGLLWALLAWHGGRSNNRPTAARKLYSEGKLEASLDAWPSRFYIKRRMISALIRSGGDARAAAESLPAKTARLYLMGIQSHLFNRFLSLRLEFFDRCLPGDLPLSPTEPRQDMQTDSAAEPSPSGPLYGPDMPRASGETGELEDEVLRQEGMGWEDFSGDHPMARFMSGGRRPLRARASGLSFRWDGSDLCLQFTLPPGAYATVLLGELMKCGRPMSGSGATSQAEDPMPPHRIFPTSASLA